MTKLNLKFTSEGVSADLWDDDFDTVVCELGYRIWTNDTPQDIEQFISDAINSVEKTKDIKIDVDY